MTERIECVDGECRVIDATGQVLQRLRLDRIDGTRDADIAWFEGCDTEGRPTIAYLYDPQHAEVTSLEWSEE